MNPFELQKQRVLVFEAKQGYKVEHAFQLLNGLDKLQIEYGPQPNSLIIQYSVKHYSLEALEKALTLEGFQFKYSLLNRLQRRIIHYCEDVQYHNLKDPERQIKKPAPEMFANHYQAPNDQGDMPQAFRELK